MNRLDAQISELMKIDDKSRFSKQLGDVLAILIENNYPYIPKIAQQVKEVDSGMVNVELKVVDKRVVQAVFHNLVKVSFK